MTLLHWAQCRHLHWHYTHLVVLLWVDGDDDAHLEGGWRLLLYLHDEILNVGRWRCLPPLSGLGLAPGGNWTPELLYMPVQSDGLVRRNPRPCCGMPGNPIPGRLECHPWLLPLSILCIESIAWRWQVTFWIPTGAHVDGAPKTKAWNYNNQARLVQAFD